ncbi:hypothetical protein AB3X94_34435 [Paraburkholderia sp. BR10923]|uniref:hypothetical protein n=1 Tax=Paraburkholderia sp. BR10923 TaxID=3236992 RepID=UPI0034CFC155
MIRIASSLFVAAACAYKMSRKITMKSDCLVGAGGVLAACFLSGCAAPTTFSDESVHISTSETSVHFVRDSISGAPVTPTDIVNAVASAANANTHFPLRTEYKYQTTKFYNFEGLYTTQTANHMTASYARGDTRGAAIQTPIPSARLQSKVSFSVDVDSVGESSAKIKIGPEASVRLCTEYPELAATQTLAADLRSALSSPENFIIHRSAPVSGEINVPFNSESTYANFLRKLGAYQFSKNEPKASDIEKFAAYNLQVGTRKVPLYVNVMPYRNGSKVLYKMNVPYELRGNGVQTIGLNDINEAKKKIAAVAND